MDSVSSLLMIMNKREQIEEISGQHFAQEPSNQSAPQVTTGRLKARRRWIITSCLVIFLTALGVRLLLWQDNRFELGKVETFVTSDYKDSAQQLLDGDWRAFVSDLNHMEHPPGYSILIAVIFRVFGNSDTAIQFVQLTCDAAAAVVIFLLVFELLPKGAALIAGLLAALSPQFAYYSVLLLPDSLAVLPILLAVYLIVRASKRPRLSTLMAAGALVGLSCWLRANALLLTPFLAAVIPVLFERGKRLRYAAALILGTLIVIAPITIKNVFVFRHFIPLSFGAGQKLLQGIAEYDNEGKFGIPKTDLGIMRQEAEIYQKPDYALLLFGPDGIKRDRMRLARGLAVIRSHPFWYFGVMLRRAVSFFRLARVPIVLHEPAVTHSLEIADNVQPSWSITPPQLIASDSVASKQAKVSLVAGDRALQIICDDSKYGNQIVSPPIAVRKNTDYLFRLPVKLEDGRMIVTLADAAQNALITPVVIDLVEGVSPQEQPARIIAIPFVSGSASLVRFILSNGASTPVRSVAQLSSPEIFELGPTAYRWTRYPRFLIRNLQRFFLTVWMLPLTIAGILLLVRTRHRSALAILLIVPVYYLCVQSALHTERRYVIAIHYFLFMMAAVALYWTGGTLRQMLGKLQARRRTA